MTPRSVILLTFVALFCRPLFASLSWLRDEPYFPDCAYEVSDKIRQKKLLLVEFGNAARQWEKHGEFLTLEMNPQGKGRFAAGEDVVHEGNAIYYNLGAEAGRLMGYHPRAGTSPFDSRTSCAFTEDHSDWAMFAMDREGKLRGSNYRKHGVFHHSAFFAGGPVAGVGGLRVHEGRVNGLSNFSGHYTPTVRYVAQALLHLYRLEVLENEVQIKILDVNEAVFTVTLEELRAAL